MKGSTFKAWAVFAAAVCTWLLLAALTASAELVNIGILHTNDTRGRIQSYYYQSSKPLGGYAKRAIYFKEKRRHQGLRWLTLDAGNALGYTPLSYYLDGYLDVRLMSMLDYDAAGLGPFDFAIGRQKLAERISEAAFPFLSANVLDQASGRYLGEPFKVIDLGDFRVALLGLTDPSAPSQVPAANTSGLTFRDPHEVAAEWVPQLKNQADTIFLLSTLKLSDNIQLAVAHPEISVIVSGGQMAALSVPLKVDNSLIVQAGFWGAKAGLLKITFEGDRQNGYKLRYFDEHLEELGGRWVENTDYLAVIAEHRAHMDEQLDVVIGSLASAMPPDKLTSFETLLGNLFADAVREASETEIALLEASAFRGGLPAGPITRGDLLKAYPGESRIVKGVMRGADLRELLSQGAENVGRGSFLQVSGVSFGIFGGEAHSVRVGGVSLRPEADYTVAVTDRMAEGLAGLTAVHALKQRQLYPYLVREVVEDYLSDRSEYSPELEERISYFAEQPEERLSEEAEAEEPSPESVTDEAEETPIEYEAEEATTEVPSPEEGAPGEEAAPDEYEVIVEEETDLGLAPAPEAEVEEVAATEPVVADLPPAAPAGEFSIGSTTVEMEGLTYDFGVNEVTLEGQPAIQLVLKLSNTGETHKMLKFPTGQHYDFKVYRDDKLLWNYAYNRYFTEEGSSLSLAPGDEVVFRAYWDGTDNKRMQLEENLYRFVAELTTTPVQEVSFIALFAPLVN